MTPFDQNKIGEFYASLHTLVNDYHRLEEFHESVMNGNPIFRNGTLYSQQLMSGSGNITAAEAEVIRLNKLMFELKTQNAVLQSTVTSLQANSPKAAKKK
jgi:hypothetical protein